MSSRGIRRRIRQLEGRKGPESCPKCRGYIIFEEHHEDRSITYPYGEPCPLCDSFPPDGSIARIVMDLTAGGGGVR